jgi:cellulose biosynthesis protein BcsQ
VKQVQNPRLNPKLKISGILPIRTDNTNLSRNTVENLREHFGKLVLPEIKQRVTIGEAHAAGEDIFTYDPESDGAAMFRAVVDILKNRG